MKEKSQFGRYLNLLSDLAFKHTFGSEPHKELTISFLNSILGKYGGIANIDFVNTIQVPANPNDKSVIVDLECKTSDGRHILIELQKRRQEFFRERSLYYVTWPIQKQGIKGKWDYNFSAVYLISLLDFALDSDKSHEIVRTKIISDIKTHEVWTEKLIIFNLELSRFRLSKRQCKSIEEKWFFSLKNMHTLKERPQEFDEPEFQTLFQINDRTILDRNERQSYDESESEYLTMKNALDYAIKTGREEGREEGRLEGIVIGKTEGILLGEARKQFEIAKKLLDKGLAPLLVSESTGIELQEVEKIASGL